MRKLLDKMKNQYFGDINDYCKFGILRGLQERGESRVLISWMLTEDDGGRDGASRGYLRQPALRRYDPLLYDRLAMLLASSPVPHVSLIEQAALIPRAEFHSAHVPNDRPARAKWQQSLMAQISQGEPDLVFFDPDNGIEVPSKPLGRAGSSKYVLWQELSDTWAAGASLLIYQHYPRKPRDAFVPAILDALRVQLQAPLTLAFCAPRVMFAVAAQPQHQDLLLATAESVAESWNGVLELRRD